MTIPTIQCKAMWTMALLFCALAILPAVGHAAITIPGADGSDGELHITEDTTINLGLAAIGTWDSGSSGNGVYDPSQWAVVFKYESVRIDSGATLSFQNNASRAPVVWLVDGDVTINGVLDLSGAAGHPAEEEASFAEPGPGGFRGGRGHEGNAENQRGSAGMGPGGGDIDSDAWRETYLGTGGAFGHDGGGWWVTRGLRYGNHRLVPLVGGSGGATPSGTDTAGGGAGGGAVLIAAEGTVTVNGTIIANGGDGVEGSGSGAGGGVRILADVFNGAGTIHAQGGTGGQAGGPGRTRLECNTNDFTGTMSPTPYQAATAESAALWPDEVSDPSVEVVSLGEETLTSDPTGQMTFGSTDISLETTGDDELVIEARNVPLDAQIIALVIPLHGERQEIEAAYDSGDESLSYWKAILELKNGVSAFQVRVDL